MSTQATPVACGLQGVFDRLLVISDPLVRVHDRAGSAKTALMNCFYSIFHCFGLFLGLFWGNCHYFERS